MNLLADALVPYLLSNGIQYQRNRPEMTAGSSIREANQGEYDLYLALHSNAAPEGRYGEERGIIAFYYPGSVGGQRAAELIAQELRKIYPLPNKVTTRPTTSLGEVRQPRFPSVLLEIGYHDNYSDDHLAGGPLGCHRPADCPGPDGVFRPALYLPHGPDAGHRVCEQRHTEPAGLSILLRQGDRPTFPTAPLLRSTANGTAGIVVHYGDQVGYAAAAYINT